MKNGTCPKCSSTEVYAKPYGLDGTRLDDKMTEHLDYVCTDCGYYESYFIDIAALNKIKERAAKLGDWKKIK